MRRLTSIARRRFCRRETGVPSRRLQQRPGDVQLRKPGDRAARFLDQVAREVLRWQDALAQGYRPSMRLVTPQDINEKVFSKAVRGVPERDLAMPFTDPAPMLGHASRGDW